jgi:peptidoglycan/xylan/chitin deacetylase (PgdA/CDA1 family)
MNLRLNLYKKKLKLKSDFNRLRYGDCTVLLYHRVIDTTYDPQQLCVSPDIFSEQLKFLKRKYNFINVHEFDEHLKKNVKFKKRSLLLTFDDGYADNLQNALPVLEREELQALFYISIKNLNNSNIFWWDELDAIIREPSQMNKERLSYLLNERKVNNIEELYSFYLRVMKTAPDLKKRDHYLDEIRGLKSVSEKEKSQYRCLTYEELKQMSASKQAVLGAHSVNHLSLGHLNRTDQEYEITVSIKELEKIIQKSVKHFSFPYGEAQNFNNDTIEICRDKNLEHAAANYAGYVHAATDRFSFPRMVVRNDDPEVVHQKIKALL